MQDAPATTETTTDAPPENKGDNDDGDGKDTQVTTRTTTIEPDGKGEDNDDNKEKQGSSSGPKAIEMGKCPIPGHTHNEFGECKPIASLTETQETEGNENNVVTAPVQTCANQLDLDLGIHILSPNTNNCVNTPLVDHPSTFD